MSTTSNTAPYTTSATGNGKATRFLSAMTMIILAVCALIVLSNVVSLPDQPWLIAP